MCLDQYTQQDPPDFPPAPWRMSGTMWIGVFPVAQALAVPAGLIPVLPRHLVVAVIRYLHGTLHYDEFMIAGLARRGHRVGAHIHQIWVDSPVSQQGGRHIWGLSKRLASFDWREETVRIIDNRGWTVTLTTQPKSRFAIPMLLPLSVFGNLHEQLTFAMAPACAKVSPAALQINEWPDQFPTLAKHTSALNLIARRFSIVVSVPRQIGVHDGPLVQEEG